MQTLPAWEYNSITLNLHTHSIGMIAQTLQYNYNNLQKQCATPINWQQQQICTKKKQFNPSARTYSLFIIHTNLKKLKIQIQYNEPAARLCSMKKLHLMT